MQTSRLTPTAIVRRQAPACGMLRALIAVLTLTLVGNSIASAQGPASTNAIRQTLLEVGISKHVKVKEMDGSTVKGTLTAIHDDSFQIIPSDGGAPLAISFAQVAAVTRGGMSKGVKTTVEILVFVTVFFVAIVAFAAAVIRK